MSKKRVHWGGFLCAAIVGAALISIPLNERAGESGKDKRVWSGRSYADRTLVESSPSASLAAAGFDSERVWSGYDDWEPAVAADPSSSYVYQLTTRYDGPAPCSGCPLPVIVFRRSSDSGATWNADQFLVRSKKKQNDPEIEVATDGTIYAAWLDDYTPGVKFLKSANRGATWTTPIAFTGKGKKPNWSDRPILAISPNGQHVYVAFNASNSYVVASHDYGQTFSSPVKTNNDARYWFHTGGAVTASGVAYFAAVDFSQDYTADAYINVLKTTNGGTSWTTTRVDTSREMPGCDWSPGCGLGFFGPSAALAVDTAGKIVLAYNAGETAGSPQKMFVRSSTNGTAWTARQEVSNGSFTVNNAFPALARGPVAGDFRLAWQDDRNDPTRAWNTWYRRSTDGGATWSAEVRLSDLGSGAPYKAALGYSFPYGDYFDMAVDASGRNHMAWGEGESYTGPGGTWYTRGQ
ncbi:MAG: sialidase family protein [Acidobacteriota bacterium]